MIINKKLNLSRQLLISVFTIYFLITIFVTLVHIVVEYKYTESNIENELKVVVATFEPALKEALWDLDSNQVQRISDGLMNMPLVFGVEITNPDNKKIIKKIDAHLSVEEIEKKELFYPFSIHKKFNDKDIFLADVVIYSDDKAILDRLKVGFSMLLLNAFIKSTVLIILLIIAFREKLEKPLQSLTKSISGLDWEDKTQRHIDVAFTQYNELSILQLEFNQLLAKISAEEDEKFRLIVAHNEELESDVKERTQALELANEKLQKLATTDILTGLYNRAKIDEEIQKLYKNFQRTKRLFSIVMIDIDDFKAVNDEYGHQKGDYVLTTIAEIFRKNSRLIDAIGRWGGEEFMIVCDDTDLEGGYGLAEHLRKKIQTHYFEGIGHKTASFGIAQIEEGMSFERLVKKADDALYTAKRSGKNRSIKSNLDTQV